jgi:pimeloyl-ACP methyl ester carboxylesterase
MRLMSVTTSDGVCEQEFILDDIPGVLWFPAGPAARRPLVLLGHGGGQDKKGPGLVARARQLVTDCGFAAAAIDMPGFGDRPKTERDEQFIADVRARRATGEPVASLIAGTR